MDYSSENTLLRRQSREDQRLAGNAVYSDQCAICFRPQRSEGNNFKMSAGIKIQPLQNFGFLLTTPPKVGRLQFT